jgi:hypothetical protein
LRVLVVTEGLAEESVRQYISKPKAYVDAIALPVSVAALITTKYAA